MIFRGSQVAIVAAYFVLLIVVGTVGYELIEGWNWADSFYMTIITITAVGYHEVHPLSETGAVWVASVLVRPSVASFMDLSEKGRHLSRHRWSACGPTWAEEPASGSTAVRRGVPTGSEA